VHRERTPRRPAGSPAPLRAATQPALRFPLHAEELHLIDLVRSDETSFTALAPDDF
jgi:hypothetical protein